MKINLKITIAIVCMFFSTSGWSSLVNGTVDHLVFFGDSLSDNGNLYRYDLGYLPSSPPYFAGRFSNGYVWSDILTLSKPHLSSENYAVGGETAVFHPPSPEGNTLPLSLNASIDYYLARSAFKDRTTTLYFIWIGANDYLPLGDSTEHIASPTELPYKVTQNISSGIEKLISYGGNKFILINLPDLSKTPSAAEQDNKSLLHALTILHNLGIQEVIEHIQTIYPQVNIRMFDLNDIFENLLKDTQKYNEKYGLHIGVTKFACWQGGYTKGGSISTANIQQDINEFNIANQAKRHSNYGYVNNLSLPDIIQSSPTLREAYRVQKAAKMGTLSCIDPDAYLFWDKLHPTSVIHGMLAYRMIILLDQEFGI